MVIWPWQCFCFWLVICTVISSVSWLCVLSRDHFILISISFMHPCISSFLFPHIKILWWLLPSQTTIPLLSLTRYLPKLSVKFSGKGNIFFWLESLQVPSDPRMRLQVTQATAPLSVYFHRCAEHRFYVHFAVRKQSNACTCFFFGLFACINN